MNRIAVGLGNPGPDYEWTPHNVGFHALDWLARREGLIFEPADSLEGFDGPRASLIARVHDPDALLVKPGTWMNRSGEVVASLARWAGADPARVLVVFDDLDLPLGRLRLRPHGGTGGHRGMRSIVDELGSDRFPRLRIGIGPARGDPSRFVLARFTPEERSRIEEPIAQAGRAIWEWLRTGDIEKCMTRFHAEWSQGPESPERPNPIPGESR